MMQPDKEYRCHGGTVGYYTHDSNATRTPMKFSLFLPPQAEDETVPYLLFLSGLTCTEENFTTKAGAYQKASELGVAILAPDTSPRGEGVPDDEAYDLGQGAGFYLDATQEPWAKHFQMESYIIQELLPLVESRFPLDLARRSICGHSMGGHGALTLYFKYPQTFISCSCFSPIVAPSQVPWGKKAFRAYLGDAPDRWQDYDACVLVGKARHPEQNRSILIDQGLDDSFLEEQLKPHLFEAACQKAGQKLRLRTHPGYDHSYFFIQSFIDDHLAWHFQK
ncbi:MAG: S-formylglutathione hydrolase [Cyanobacteriota bacterium]|nr:S-formylglutathione hydrolase [Cyanobacteriota bacterium]